MPDLSAAGAQQTEDRRMVPVQIDKRISCHHLFPSGSGSQEALAPKPRVLEEKWGSHFGPWPWHFLPLWVGMTVLIL